jgi:hypothetical protein
MHKHTWQHIRRLASVATLACFGLGFMVNAASAQSAVTFAEKSAAGSPGSSITVSSITPCPPLPPGVQGPPIVSVVLAQGTVDARGIGSAELPVSASGTWGGTLTVGGSASQGAAVLDASCFSSAQAGPATLAYQSAAVTITELAAPTPQPVTITPRFTG